MDIYETCNVSVLSFNSLMVCVLAVGRTLLCIGNEQVKVDKIKNKTL